MRLAMSLGACALLAACASGRLEQNGPGIQHAPPRAAAGAAQAALARVHAGDTREQVATALGPANIVSFESGWQVWVYRWLGADNSTSSATELVILFQPDGTVRKARVRRPEGTSVSLAAGGVRQRA